MTLRNTILYGNRDQLGFGDLFTHLEGGSLTVDADHSDLGLVLVEGGVFQDLGGNSSVDPMLDRRQHLRAGSPLVDAGTCAGAPATDLDGDPRPTGPGCDNGADELSP